jgi:predicted RNA binding protein YcfA (HicA-like mRNA interferase family)
MPASRPVSGAETVRALERLGFRQTGRHGMHVVLERDGDASGCVVPLQDELPAGALMGILRQADLSADDFYRALDQQSA